MTELSYLAKLDPQQLSQCGSTCICLSRSVHEIQWRVAGTLSSQQTYPLSLSSDRGQRHTGDISWCYMSVINTGGISWCYMSVINIVGIYWCYMAVVNTCGISWCYMSVVNTGGISW